MAGRFCPVMSRNEENRRSANPLVCPRCQKKRCGSWPQSKTPMRSVGSWNIWVSGWPTPGRLPGLIRPLGSHRYTRIPTHSFRPLRKKTTPSSRQPTGTVEFLRRARCVFPFVAPLCLDSRQSACFSPLPIRICADVPNRPAHFSPPPQDHARSWEPSFLTHNSATCYSPTV
jgi:hypothetical protein